MRQPTTTMRQMTTTMRQMRTKGARDCRAFLSPAQRLTRRGAGPAAANTGAQARKEKKKPACAGSSLTVGQR